MQQIPGPLVYDERSSTGHREIFESLPVGVELFMNYGVFFDDFNRVALDSNTVHRWTAILDAGCTAAIDADSEFGSVKILSDADDEGGSLQGNEVYKLTSNKRFIFEARVKLLDADDQDMFIGLAENHTTNPEAALTASNRIGFQIDDGNASILCKAEASDVEASEDSGSDASDTTWVRLSMLYDGKDLHFYVDRVKKATIAAASLPSALMAPTIFHLDGGGTDGYLLVDYVFIASER